MLLYEEGAFFTAHRDTEKVPGMFGTLVVCLPSAHTGLDVRLVYGNTERILRTADDSKFDMTALAWYSDVKHEVRPVLSGYRLVLTCNLIQDQRYPKQGAALINQQQTRLTELLRAWHVEGNDVYQDFFVYPLDHEYTDASLSLRNLKGADAVKGRLLEQACAKNGAYWFLGTLTKCEGDEDSFTVEHIVTPTGKQILRNLAVNEDAFLRDAESFYEDRTPDSEEEEEYTGSYATPACSRYHDTALVIMRKKAFFDHCTKNAEAYGSLDTFAAFTGMVQKELAVSPEDNDSTIRKFLNWMLSELSKRLTDSNRQAKIQQYYERVRELCYTNERSEVVRSSLRWALQQKSMTSSPVILEIAVKDIAMAVVEDSTPS